ncbi:MAG: hypothetical protein Q8861_14175 [Bacteroidota bacterium]|nr:hypothetical protein [Bacteroidota bacterium]MDP4272305.1 hypothetical protein [Bacteroidota bacterium]
MRIKCKYFISTLISLVLCYNISAQTSSFPLKWIIGKWHKKQYVLQQDTLIQNGIQKSTGQKTPNFIFVEHNDSSLIVFTCDSKSKSRYSCPVIMYIIQKQNKWNYLVRFVEEAGTSIGSISFRQKGTVVLTRTLQKGTHDQTAISETWVRGKNR